MDVEPRDVNAVYSDVLPSMRSLSNSATALV